MKLTSIFVSILLAVALVMLLSVPSKAMPQCGARELMVEFIQKKYKEEQIGLGIAKNGQVVTEIWMNGQPEVPGTRSLNRYY